MERQERQPSAGRRSGPDGQNGQNRQNGDIGQAGPDVPSAAPQQTEVDGEALRGLIGAARVVLLDFDGPVCRLFAARRAEQVAAQLVAWVADRGLHDTILEQDRLATDPQRVLAAVGSRHPGSDLILELEELLTSEEVRAAVSAWPTPYTDPLVMTWAAMGMRLAVTTNNSPRAVHGYLADRGLSACFAPHVYGRDPARLHLLKPAPHCLVRAMNATGTPPAAALMIGDTPADFAAAQEAGVPFLGYAHSERKANALREAGVERMVGSMKTVLDVVRQQAR